MALTFTLLNLILNPLFYTAAYPVRLYACNSYPAVNTFFGLTSPHSSLMYTLPRLFFFFFNSIPGFNGFCWWRSFWRTHFTPNFSADYRDMYINTQTRCASKKSTDFLADPRTASRIINFYAVCKLLSLRRLINYRIFCH